ncbi:hypothetical protein BGZ76_003042 [Entomortierella beljakovae]|nr:hypothetical protein BGZ76_003042 [Entomortierella beljakovae]
MNEGNDQDPIATPSNVTLDITNTILIADSEQLQTANDNDATLELVLDTSGSDRSSVTNMSAEQSSSSGHVHSFMPSLPPTSSTRVQISREQSMETVSDGDLVDDNMEVDDPSRPKPLAVKPTYKKRIVVPATRSDGLIRKSGALAALEKQLWERLPNDKRTPSTPSIYDVPTPVENDQFPAQSQRQQPPPKKPKKLRSRPRPPKPPPKIKQKKRITLWRPLANDSQDPHHLPPNPPRRTRTHGLVQPINVEWLVKQQEMFKKKTAQLSMKPLPFQDLKTLVGTELDEEEKALRELGILLHKEYLKLQLEEGVLMTMLNISQAGTLDVSDLEKLSRRTKWSKSELRLLAEGSRARRKGRQSRRSQKDIIQQLRGSNIDTPINIDNEGADIRFEDIEAEGTPDEEDSEGDQEEEEDDDEEDVGDQDEDVGEDDSETDLDNMPPIYSLPGESYSSRPLATLNESLGESSIGRPGASIPQTYNSLDAIKKLVSQNGKKRKYDETALVDDDDLYELEYDEENIEGEEEEEGSALGSEEGDEDYYSDSNGYDDDEQQDEDDQTAREALQRMLSLYGAGT